MKTNHQTLFNFAILAGKRQKRTFSYGPSHRGPPPKYATELVFKQEI